MSGARKPSPTVAVETPLPPRERVGPLRSLESARRKLGGSAIVPSDRSPGVLVETPLTDGLHHAGILLWSSAGYCDIWFDDGVARRVRSGIVDLRARPTPESLLGIEAEVRMFSTLVEGERVRWERAASLVEGRIAEKCRYGAIVVALDAKVTAVGFRKLWPAVVQAVA
jgi:hypothetical protein